MAPPKQTPQQKPAVLAAISGNSWLIAIVVGGLFNTGMTYQQFTEVRKNQEISSAEQKHLTAKVNDMREKQVEGIQDIQTLKRDVQTIDNRVLVIERIFIEQPKRGVK